jgi:hypothetical protein
MQMKISQSLSQSLPVKSHRLSEGEINKSSPSQSPQNVALIAIKIIIYLAFKDGLLERSSSYPLVNVYIAMENHHVSWENSRSKW